MRISKFLLTVCAATLCAGLISARADEDNPAQAAARAALMEKMTELNQSQPAAQTPTNATAPVETNAPAAATPPPIVVTPSGATVEQPSQPTNAVTETPVPASAPVVTSSPTNPVVQPTEPAPAPAVAAPATVETKPTAASPSGAQGWQPIVAPPLPISATKEDQLQALDAKYKADQITPEEYFKQRAAILAQPDSASH